MFKEKNADVIKQEKNIYLLKIEEKKKIFIEEKVLNFDKNSSFNNIDYCKAELELDSHQKFIGIEIIFENDEYIDDIYEIIVQRKDNDFERIFYELNEVFTLKKNISWDKFRGDFGEALYLFFNKGTKSNNEFDTFDFFDENKEKIELKTYSKQKKTILISHEQLQQNVKLFIVPLEVDNNGKTILEVAKEINDQKFGLELKNKYQNSKWKNYRFKLNKPTEFFLKNRYKFNLPKGINKAIYEINIDID